MVETCDPIGARSERVIAMSNCPVVMVDSKVRWCARCGTRRRGRYCPVCGQTRRWRNAYYVLRCGRCGETHTPDAEHCHACGTRLRRPLLEIVADVPFRVWFGIAVAAIVAVLVVA